MVNYIFSQGDILVLHAVELVSDRSKEAVAITATLLDPETLLPQIDLELSQVKALLLEHSYFILIFNGAINIILLLCATTLFSGLFLLVLLGVLLACGIILGLVGNVVSWWPLTLWDHESSSRLRRGIFGRACQCFIRSSNFALGSCASHIIIISIFAISCRHFSRCRFQIRLGSSLQVATSSSCISCAGTFCCSS